MPEYDKTFMEKDLFIKLILTYYITYTYYVTYRNEENSPEAMKDYRRIWFEIRAPAAKIVLLSVCLNFNQIYF